MVPKPEPLHLVKKKKLREYKLINLTMHLNVIIKRDANLLLFINKFTDKFTDYYIISLVDLYFNYN
jgi:hypothetical protein